MKIPIDIFLGIYITVRGYGDVRWTEHRTRNGANRRRVTDTVWYRAHDDYFNSRVDVLRSPDGNRFDLVPGKYEYNYQILLPSELPSSFNGQYGTVRYEVICTIDRPWKFDNVFKHPFTTIRPLDFNQATIYMVSIESFYRNIFQVCVKRNLIKMMVHGFSVDI